MTQGVVKTTNPTSLIQDMVRSGRITPEQGARLLQLRSEIAWARKPWWEKALIVIVRLVVG